MDNSLAIHIFPLLIYKKLKKSVFIWVRIDFLFSLIRRLYKVIHEGIMGFSTAFTIVIHIIPKVIHLSQ